MFDIPKIPKNVQKKIKLYHQKNLKWFFILLGTGILFLIFAIIFTKLVVFFDIVSVEIVYVIIGMLYIFTFTAPFSVFLLLRYYTDLALTSETFRKKIRLTMLIEETKVNKEEKIIEFQKRCRQYTSLFYGMYWDYFKHYKKRDRTSYLNFSKYFIEFDKIITLATINVEVKSNKTNDLLKDFSIFLDEVENKIHIPILERNINRNNVKNFCQKWTKYFKDNYYKKYLESSKILDEHMEMNREKQQEMKQRNKLIIFGVVSSIIGGLILLIIQKLIEYYPL